MQTKTKFSLKNKKPRDYILEEIDKGLEVANFYGFLPIKSPKPEKKDLTINLEESGDFILHSKIDNELAKSHHIHNKICVLRNYMEGSFKELPFPHMFCFRVGRSMKNQAHSPLNLLVIGQTGNIAEVISIKTSLAILNEQEQEDLSLEVNNIGNRDSFSKFEKDFANYIKKNSNNGNQDIIPTNNRNLGEVINKYLKEESPEFWSQAPKPINYLDQQSIESFKETLEYLENLETPYSLNHFLIPNQDYCHQAVFQIKRGEEVLALGVKHYNVIKKLGFRKEVPFLSVAIKDTLVNKKLTNIKKIKPKFFLVQFGAKAKAKSLMVLEMLRKAKIPIYHLLTRDKLANQLSAAENLKFSYILIIGEKEAIENSVMVRNNETRVQETVPVSHLVSFLKKVKL